MARPREVLPHAVRVPDSGSVAAQRAESFDIDRCPNDASSVLAGDRKAGTARRIPDRPTSTRPHAPGAHAPLRRSTSTRRVPRATVLEPPESGRTDLDLALAHYLPLPTLFPDEPENWAGRETRGQRTDGKELLPRYCVFRTDSRASVSPCSKAASTAKLTRSRPIVATATTRPFFR